jgi:poly(3-hydroxyalkanoate) depolymerase
MVLAPVYTSSADLGKTLGPQTPGFLCLCRSLSTFATGTNPILKRCGFTVGTGFLTTCRCRRFPAQGHHGQLFLRGLKVPENRAAIIFDVPGIGGSPLPSIPYRPSTLARLAADLVTQLGHRQVDVAGVSWGGGVAQQFAHQHGDTCRKLVLAATSPGAIMVPGRLSVILKLATPRRYFDRNYMRSIAAEIYGGALRRNPELIARHAQAMFGASSLGYLLQLLAITGWTSLPWLASLRQPTLVLMGRDDPLVPPVNGRILARLIPNARLQMIDDGHLFMVTQPVETARTIEAFLNEQCAATGRCR